MSPVRTEENLIQIVSGTVLRDGCGMCTTTVFEGSLLDLMIPPNQPQESVAVALIVEGWRAGDCFPPSLDGIYVGSLTSLAGNLPFDSSAVNFATRQVERGVGGWHLGASWSPKTNFQLFDPCHHLP